jgi:multiple sugar transport system permease protein
LSYSNTRLRQERVAAIVLLAPAVTGLCAFVVLPIAAAFGISFFDWSGLKPPTFAGLDNYSTLLSDSDFPRSLLTTATFAVGYVVGLYTLSLALALIVSQRTPGSKLFRAAYIVPVMVAPAVAAVIWKYVFDERSGFLNALLGALGVGPIPWLGDQQLALVAITLVAIWQAVGYMTIIQLAGLDDIPREYYEAAKVDGAGASGTFRNITMPLLRPTTAFVLIVALIDALQVFDIAFVLTRGGPAGATTTSVMYIYRQSFEYLNFGYGSAIAVVLFAIIFAVSFVLLRILGQQRAQVGG